MHASLYQVNEYRLWVFPGSLGGPIKGVKVSRLYVLLNKVACFFAFTPYYLKIIIHTVISEDFFFTEAFH